MIPEMSFWLSIFIGFCFGMLNSYLAVIFFTELRWLQSRAAWFWGWIIFFSGLASFFVGYSFVAEVTNRGLLVSAIAGAVLMEYVFHRSLIKEIKANSGGISGFLMKIIGMNKVKEKQKGVFELQNWMWPGGAYASKFGLIVLYKKPLLSRIFSGDYTEEQKQAFLSHERGHNIFGLPLLALQMIAIYLILAGTGFSWLNLLLLPAVLFFVETVFSWIGEYLSDVMAGRKLLSLKQELTYFKLPAYLGSVGRGGHPAWLIRFIAAHTKAAIFVVSVALIIAYAMAYLGIIPKFI